MQTQTIAAAFAQWQELASGIPSDDRPMLAESWNDYTDSLTKDGAFNALQYHHCPAFDDEMPSDDLEFIAEALGVTMDVRRIDARTDGSEWDKAASHWVVTLHRGAWALATEYSMGSAFTGEPAMGDVLGCLLSDSDGIAGETFEDWADNMGMDTDSRRALTMFEACQDTERQIAEMFTPAELDDLRQIAAER